MHWRRREWLSSPKSMGGMGFSDMRVFNQPMLGCQGWRLLTVSLTDPTSLCACVLKGCYYPMATCGLHLAHDQRFMPEEAWSMVES
jgi:hypothetical protein